jgi:HK97 family phage portal protein
MPNLIDRIAGFLTGSAPTTAPASTDLIERATLDVPSSSMLHRADVGPRKGAEELLQLYKHAPWLRAVAHQVAKGVASAQWKLYAQRKKGTTKDDPTYIAGDVWHELRTAAHDRRFDELHRAVGAGEIDEITTHPFLALLERPNPSMTGFESRLVTQVHRDLIGESFWILDRDESTGVVTEYRPVPPTWVKSLPTEKKPYFTIKFSTLEYRVPMTEVLWHRDIDPADPYGRGTGLGLAMADELDIDEHAAKMLAGFFQNKGIPDAIVSLKGARPEIIERAKRKWENAVKGFRKAYSTYFTGAEIDVKRLDTSFKDMALVDIRKAQRDLIVSVYGMPPEKIGILANSNKATIEAADIIEAKNVLVPRLEAMRAAMQSLASQFDDRLIVEYVSPIPGDREFQRSVMERFSSMFTIDEVRAMAGMEPLPEEKGKAFLVEPGKQYVADLATLNTAPIYGYHLSAGVTTYNEMRARLGLEPTTEPWGDQRTVGMYIDPSMLGLDAEAGLDDAPSLPPGEAAARVGAVRALPPHVEHRARARSDERRRRADVTVTKASAYLSGKEIKRVLRAIREDDLGGPMEPVVRALVKKYGEETVNALNNEQEFDVDAPDVRDHFKTFRAERVALMTTTTKFEARRVLEAWDGEDADELRADIKGVFERARVERSRTIAATEGLHSSEFATHEAMKQSGVDVSKEWISTGIRTREAHLELDGEIVGIDKPFEVKSGPHAGAQAQHPGAFGIGALDINCNCHSAPSFAALDDEDHGKRDRALLVRSGVVPPRATVEERRAVWETREAKLAKWEPKLIDAAVEGFDKQEAAVVDVLASIID